LRCMNSKGGIVLVVMDVRGGGRADHEHRRLGRIYELGGPRKGGH